MPVALLEACRLAHPACCPHAHPHQATLAAFCCVEGATFSPTRHSDIINNIQFDNVTSLEHLTSVWTHQYDCLATRQPNNSRMPIRPTNKLPELPKRLQRERKRHFGPQFAVNDDCVSPQKRLTAPSSLFKAPLSFDSSYDNPRWRTRNLPPAPNHPEGR